MDGQTEEEEEEEEEEAKLDKIITTRAHKTSVLSRGDEIRQADLRTVCGVINDNSSEYEFEKRTYRAMEDDRHCYELSPFRDKPLG